MFERYFSGIGIDFSEQHVRFAHVGCFGRVLACKEVALEEGIVIDEQIVDTKAFQTMVKKTVSEMGHSKSCLRAVCLVPESRVFSHSFLSDASLKTDEAEDEARVCAQKEIPLNFASARTVVSFGEKALEKRRTTVYAVDVSIVNKIEMSFAETGLRLVAIESNTTSIFRNIDGKKVKQKRCVGVLDIGHAWATLSFCASDGSPVFSRTIAYGQQHHFTEYHRELSEEIVDRLIGVVEEAVLYFRSKNTVIDFLLLAGTEARCTNMMQIFKIRFPHVSGAYAGDVLKKPQIKPEEMQAFAASIGAGLRAARPHSFRDQHNFFQASL